MIINNRFSNLACVFGMCTKFQAILHFATKVARTYMYIFICMYIFMYVSIYLCLCIYLCIYLCICICICIYVYINLYVYIYMHKKRFHNFHLIFGDSASVIEGKLLSGLVSFGVACRISFPLVSIDHNLLKVV